MVQFHVKFCRELRALLQTRVGCKSLFPTLVEVIRTCRKLLEAADCWPRKCAHHSAHRRQGLSHTMGMHRRPRIILTTHGCLLTLLGSRQVEIHDTNRRETAQRLLVYNAPLQVRTAVLVSHRSLENRDRTERSKYNKIRNNRLLGLRYLNSNP